MPLQSYTMLIIFLSLHPYDIPPLSFLFFKRIRSSRKSRSAPAQDSENVLTDRHDTVLHEACASAYIPNTRNLQVLVLDDREHPCGRGEDCKGRKLTKSVEEQQ